MNPDTNKFEQIDETAFGELLRPNGEPVPKHWSVFTVGETVVIKDYTFKVAHLGEGHILLEPMAPVIVAETEPMDVAYRSQLMKQIDGMK